MKKTALLIACILTAVFSLSATAATISKSNIINGKWQLTDGVYSTVSVIDENHSIGKYTVKYGSYSAGDITFSFKSYALKGSNEYSAVLFGSYDGGSFSGIAFKLTGNGIVITEYLNGNSLDIKPADSINGIIGSDDEGNYYFNTLTVKRENDKISVLLNGKVCVDGYSSEAFEAKGSVYLECLVNKNISVSFASVTLLELGPSESSAASPESSDAASSESSESTDSIGIGGGNLPENDFASNSSLKYAAFVSVCLIGVVAAVSAVISIVDAVKKKKG